MPRHFKYVCTRCGKKPAETDIEAKGLLTAKVAVFKEVGYGGRTIRSRVTDWLCDECRDSDPDYNTGDRSFIDKVAEDIQ